MKKILMYAAAAIMGATFAGCSQVELKPTPITPLYSSLAKYPGMTATQRDSFMRTDSTELLAMMQYLGKGPVDDATLMEFATSPAMKVFTPAVDSVFPKIRPIENTLGMILANAKTHGFDFPKRHYAAVVWGNYKSIVFTDSCMLLALNHYLGADDAGYAAWPAYMRLDKTPKRMAYDIVEALVANEFPYVRTPESTVLSRIVYEGAITLAKIKLVPNGTLSEALGYTTEQLEWLYNHESELWNALVGRNLLYSTSEDVAEKLVSPAPSTPLVSPYSPGRVGRYIGYCILVSYLENNSTTSLPHLLTPEFYDNPSLLVESAYGG